MNVSRIFFPIKVRPINFLVNFFWGVGGLGGLGDWRLWRAGLVGNGRKIMLAVLVNLGGFCELRRVWPFSPHKKCSST